MCQVEATSQVTVLLGLGKRNPMMFNLQRFQLLAL